VHEAQDALSDRLVTMDLEYYDRETEIRITSARSNLNCEDVARIVDIVRNFRASGEYDQVPTMRSCIMISRVVSQQNLCTKVDDARFVNVCLDVLESKTAYTSQARDRRAQQRKLLLNLIEHYTV
jgi:gas vesicle protein GvpN